MKGKTMKICFAASSGGHFEQLMMLRPLMDKYSSFIVTEKTPYNANSKFEKTIYFLKQINRQEIMLPIYLINNTIKSLKILLIEKPDIIITTGVLAVIPLCIIAKLFRKKIIYIESFAKLDSPTLTGKLIYKFADQFYVQWPSMLKIYPKAIYKGGIY